MIKPSKSTQAQSLGIEPLLAPVAGIGRRTAAGAFWTITFAVLNKIVTFGSQIALAWFLLPADFGLVGMALSVASVGTLLSGMTLKVVLIQRVERFDRDVGEVFWLSLAMGLSGALLLAALSPFCGEVFRDTRVVPLILFLAGAQLLGSMPAVYAAVLSRNLRFRQIAGIQFVSGLINSLGSVLLAALHFGSYSLVLPLAVSAAYALAAQRLAAGKVLIRRPSPSRWRSLLAPTVWLMLGSLLTAVVTYGANFIIGIQHSARITGFYFWGFNIASQAVFLLATNLQGVLFPALTKLNAEPERQYQAFRKATLVLLAATVPVCVLQVLLAEPVIQLLFQDRWLPAFGVVQGLSIGLTTQSIAILSSSLLMARGAFRTWCLCTGLSAALTLGATVVGGTLGEQRAVALAVGVTGLFTNVISGWFALRLLRQNWKRLIEFLTIPLLLGLGMGAVGWVLKEATSSLGSLAQTLIVTFVTLPLFACGAFLLLPEVRSLLQYRRTSTGD